MAVNKCAPGIYQVRLVVQVILSLSNGWAPIHKQDVVLGLNNGNISINIIGTASSCIYHGKGYTSPFGWLAQSKHWSHSPREVDVGIGHQVGLEFCLVKIQSSITSEGSSDTRHNLTKR